MAGTFGQPDDLEQGPITMEKNVHGVDDAPIIVFDEVGFFSVLHGIGRVSLSVQLLSASGPDGSIKAEHRMTGHLVGGLDAMVRLRGAIDKVLELSRPNEGQ